MTGWQKFLHLVCREEVTPALSDEKIEDGEWQDSEQCVWVSVSSMTVEGEASRKASLPSCGEKIWHQSAFQQASHAPPHEYCAWGCLSWRGRKREGVCAAGEKTELLQTGSSLTFFVHNSAEPVLWTCLVKFLNEVKEVMWNCGHWFLQRTFIS